MTVPNIKWADDRAQAIALFRSWIDQQFAKGKTYNQVDAELNTAMRSLIESFRREWPVPGVRYWEHPESMAHLTTGPGQPIDPAVAEQWVELQHHEYRSRQGIHFSDDDL
jgi:hypothetical protein